MTIVCNKCSMQLHFDTMIDNKRFTIGEPARQIKQFNRQTCPGCKQLFFIGIQAEIKIDTKEN